MKNFIRHGKQARERSPENQAHSYPPAASTAPQPTYGGVIVEPAPYQPSQPAAAARAGGRHYRHEYDEAAEKIVAEEREARARLPRYPGLERFKLIDKMGEYGSPHTYPGYFLAAYMGVLVVHFQRFIRRSIGIRRNSLLSKSFENMNLMLHR